MGVNLKSSTNMMGSVTVRKESLSGLDLPAGCKVDLKVMTVEGGEQAKKSTYTRGLLSKGEGVTGLGTMPLKDIYLYLYI